MNLKYIRTDKDEIVIFPPTIQHSTFKFMAPVSAGFCSINSSRKRVDCFGESYSLGLEANVREDTITATKDVFGITAIMNLSLPPDPKSKH